MRTSDVVYPDLHHARIHREIPFPGTPHRVRILTDVAQPCPVRMRIRTMEPTMQLLTIIPPGSCIPARITSNHSQENVHSVKDEVGQSAQIT